MIWRILVACAAVLAIESHCWVGAIVLVALLFA